MNTETVKELYSSIPEKLENARKKFNRPLTLTEKILIVHADDLDHQVWERGKAQLLLRPDRVAMQAATGQMALRQFMQAGKKRVAVPSTLWISRLKREGWTRASLR